MRRKVWLQFGALLAVLMALCTKTAWPQSSNRQAMNWFEAGLRETNSQKKIDAYAKAAEHDPSFVEAWFNLGMAYRERKDYVRAEEYVRKAYYIKPEKLDAGLKFKIVYELASIYGTTGKLESYEKTLHQAKALADNEQALAMLSFELGRMMYQQQRHEEALAELKDGRRYVKKDAEGYDNLIVLAENALRREKLYVEAQRIKTRGNLNGARALFVQIKAENPQFKNVAQEIAVIDSLLRAENRQNALAARYRKAQQYETEDKPEAAIAEYELLLQQFGDDKDVGARLSALRQRVALKQRNENLETAYAEGMSAVRLRDWEEAITSFEAVSAIDPNFQDTRKRLAQARRAFAREGDETVVARYYTDGVAALQRNDRGGALAAFEKVRKLNPNYRDAAALLAEIEAQLAKPVPVIASAPSPGRLEVNLDSLYQDALAAEILGDWKQAGGALEELLILQPDYRDAANRLSAIRAKQRPVEPTETGIAARESSALKIGGLIAAVLSIALLGFVVFSPAMHARYRLWRNDPIAAARIYEKSLERHPKQVKYYSPLADIYLQQGRNDERAVRVYKTVVQLKLPSRYRDELTNIIAEKFLVDGRVDQDAIEILENALKVQQRKFPHGK